MAIVETKTKSLARRHQEQKYTPDLSGFINQCERNYMQLQKLMSTNHDGQWWQFNIQETHLTSHLIEISIVERCTYTTSLRIKQFIADKVASEADRKGNPKASKTYSDEEFNNKALIVEPEMYVRLYHDAKMAEVLSCQAVGKIKPSYAYPNKKMHQKNEKSQWNVFLGEWLNHCTKTAFVTNAVLSFQ